MERHFFFVSLFLFLNDSSVLSVWDARNRVGRDQRGPHDRPLLDNAGAVGLDLGEVFLELEAAASRQPEVDQDLEVNLDQRAPEGQHRAPPVHRFHRELKKKKKKIFINRFKRIIKKFC